MYNSFSSDQHFYTQETSEIRVNTASFIARLKMSAELRAKSKLHMKARNPDMGLRLAYFTDVDSVSLINWDEVCNFLRNYDTN